MTVLVPFDIVASAVVGQKQFQGADFPLVLSPSLKLSNTGSPSALGDLISWVKTNRPLVERKLQEHGAVLFRGFPLSTASDFNAVVEAFDYEELPYVGGAAPRTNVVGRVFTANESPPHLFIPFHHEMAQVPEHPVKLFFFCEIAPSEGGETPFLLSNELYRRMTAEFPEFVEKLASLGLLYTRILPEDDDTSSAIGRGWKSTFLTTDRAVAELRAEKLGVKLTWNDDGSVKTVSGPLPALRVEQATGKTVWFNSMVAAYTGWEDVRNKPDLAVTFGDGTPLDGAAVRRCLEIMNEIAVDISWEAGDLVLLDNYLVQHGRRAFVPPRRVLASLVKS